MLENKLPGQTFKMIKTIEHYSNVHGVNLGNLFEGKVLSNESCFWSLLQSQTDRLNHYYYDQEHKIRRAMKKLSTESTTQVDIEEVRADVIWLLDFIDHNALLFASAVRKFDSYHELDTYDNEIDYFEETYSFIDGHRLQKVLDVLDVYEFEDWQKKESKKKKVQTTRGSKNKRRFSVTKEMIAIKRQNSGCAKGVDKKERKNFLKLFKSFKSNDTSKTTRCF